MLYKHALFTALSVVFLIAAVALGIAVYRSDVTVYDWFEYMWLVSLGSAILGFYLRKGASTGPDVAGYETVSYTINDREAHIEADNDDARAGMAFGTVIMLSSLAVFAVALATLKCITR